jgi:hypothetical protein
MSQECFTTALIFVKADSGKLEPMNNKLADMPEVLAAKFKVKNPRVYACSGHFDACIIGSFPTVQNISTFIVKHLHNDCDAIADTQTIVCWELPVGNLEEAVRAQA